MLVVDHVRPARTREGHAAAIFLGASFIFILAARLRVLRFDLPINPDEAMMAANAMRTRYGWLNWDILDPLTSGPLNSAILAWPYLFGADITLASTRLTGLGCVFGALGALFFAIRQLSENRTVAILALMPCVLLFGMTTSGDFVHYSSEHLPILLISLALCLFAASFKGNGLVALLGCALVLGFIPFAKLQAAPIGATIGAFAVARAAVTGVSLPAAAKRAALVVATALLASLLFLVPLALSGALDDAFKSYIVQPALRADPWSDKIPRMLTYADLFRAVTIAYAVTLLLAAVAVLIARRRGAVFTPSTSWRWYAALAATLLPVCYVAISYTGRDFHHYLLLAVPTLVLLGGVALAAVAAIRSPRATGPAFQAAVVGIVVAVVVLPIAPPESAWGRSRLDRGGEAYLRGRTLHAPHNLAWLRTTPRDSMLCWGWAPECYLNAAVRPATRETTNENQIYPLPLRDYFRARFIADVNASQPDFVVDAVAPGNFPLGDAHATGIRDFPALRDIVERDFSPVSRVDPPERCPRVYVRKSRLAELEKSLIAFSAIQASAAQPGHEATAVDDGSVFEICNDNWLLPLGTPGSLTLRFQRSAPLRTVAILNSRREVRDLPVGSHRVRLSVHHAGRVVHTRDVLVRPFPFWTTVRLDNATEADAITLDILSFAGIGGGLNEVKAYRD